MFSLTPKERRALIFVGSLLLVGGILRFFNVSTKEPLEVSEIISSPQIVSINTASQKDLERLPGIGPATAVYIIEYRNQHGNFRSLEDLKKVKGIGEKKSQALKSHISF